MPPTAPSAPAPGPPRQRGRLHQLGPGTWPETAHAAGPGWQYNLSGNPGIEMAIYPGIVRLAARNLQADNTSSEAS